MGSSVKRGCSWLEEESKEGVDDDVRERARFEAAGYDTGGEVESFLDFLPKNGKPILAEESRYQFSTRMVTRRDICECSAAARGLVMALWKVKCAPGQFAVDRSVMSSVGTRSRSKLLWGCLLTISVAYSLRGRVLLATVPRILMVGVEYYYGIAAVPGL